MEELHGKFHELTGLTKGEYQKAFNQFMQDLKYIEPERTRKFIIELQTKNKQEEIFRVQLLIKYCAIDDLLPVLLSGDRILIRILLKHVNALKLLENFSGEEFIQNICPNISYITRIKLINKMSLLLIDENRAIDFHTEICKKYGKQIAAPLLIACANEYFCKEVRSYQVKISDKQLIHLHKKDPNLVLVYFEYNKKFSHVSLTQHDLFAKYLCTNDVETFWRLLENGVPTVGKKNQIKLLKLYKQEIITGTKYTKTIYPKVAINCLNREEYFQFIKYKLGQDDIFAWYMIDELRKCVKRLPKIERFDFILRLCKEKCTSDFDITDLKSLSNILPLEHQRIMQKDLESFNIEKIKAKINLTSDIRDRKDLLVKLLETCRLYDDRASLLEVLKYFYEWHKNDIAGVRRQFLDELLEKFPLKELGDEYYQIILDLVKIFDIEGESFNKSHLLSSRVEYKFNQNLEYSKELYEFIKYSGLYGWANFNIKKLKKEHLIFYIENLNDFIENENIGEISTDILKELENWNSVYPKEEISLYKYWNLIQNHIEYLKQVEWIYNYELLRNILMYKPKLDDEKKLRKKLIKNLLDDHPEFLPPEMEMWFLRHNPEIVCKHLDTFIDRSPCLNFFYDISKMQYHPLYQKCKDLATQNKLSKDIKINLQFLSFEPNFLSIAEKYRPTAATIDVNQENIEHTVQTQIEILKLLKTQFIPENTINLLLSFCQKDYLRYALEALYVVLYHSRESALAAPIAALANRSVSIRKHAIFLVSTVGSLEQTYQILERMVNLEKNFSVRKYLIKRTFKLLNDESSEIFWHLLKSLIENISEEDGESILLLRKFKNIPDEFLPDYITTYWKCLKKYKKESKLIHLLQSDEINILPPDFCDDVIINYKDDFNWKDFVYEYLISNHSTVEERTKFIFNCIQEYNFEDLYFNLQHFCFSLINSKNPIAILIIKEFKNIVEKSSFSFNKLYLELLVSNSLVYLETPKDDFNILAKFIVKSQSKLSEQYGLQILKTYNNFIIWFYHKINIYGNQNFELLIESLATNLLMLDESDATKMLVIDLISKNMNDTVKCKFEKIINKLEMDKSSLVQIHLMGLKLNTQ